jgi:hypothetical protein
MKKEVFFIISKSVLKNELRNTELFGTFNEDISFLVNPHSFEY